MVVVVFVVGEDEEDEEDEENVSFCSTRKYPDGIRSKNFKWSKISDLLSGRLGKQCRERYYNHLDPTLIKSPWTKKEDLLSSCTTAAIKSVKAVLAPFFIFVFLFGRFAASSASASALVANEEDEEDEEDKEDDKFVDKLVDKDEDCFASVVVLVA